MSTKKKIQRSPGKGRNEKRSHTPTAGGYHPRDLPPSVFERTVRCRCVNANGVQCSATFIADLLDYYREKHERIFHKGDF